MRNLSTSYFKLLITTSLLIAFACSSNVHKGSGDLVSIDSTKKEVYILSKGDSLDGKKVYDTKCMVCHQADGNGIPGLFPTLAGSDYLVGNKQGAIGIILHGCKDSVVVNGTIYKKRQMPETGLNEQQVINVTNYILNSWGNKGGHVGLKEVNAAR
jgi:nitrite reductase (NO-forming)